MFHAEGSDGEARKATVDRAGLGRILEDFRPRLRRMVNVRIDPRLRGRVDPSDVLQEAFVEVTQRLDEYRRQPEVPFFVWVRFLAGQKLLEIHRRHLDAAKRDVRREASPPDQGFPEASSLSLAGMLVDGGVSPSGAAIRAESEQRLTVLLDSMKPIDREVLALRHFEQLSNDETAEVLGLSRAVASLRYTRAIKRLGELFERLDDRGTAE